MLTLTLALSVFIAPLPTQAQPELFADARIVPADDLFATGPFKAAYDAENDAVLLIFDRVACDQIDDSCVSHYEAESNTGAFWELDQNFLQLNHHDLDTDQPMQLSLYAVDHNRARILLGHQTLDADGLVLVQEEAAKRATPSPKTPIMGRYNLLTGSSNQTSGPWGFWEHRSGYHAPGRGIGGADDTHAVDINLNVRNAGRDMDSGMPFFAAGAGTVVKYHGTVSPSSRNGYALLIEHGTSSDRWWAGYLHASQLNVRVGDRVTEQTRLGFIGATGNTNNTHLHYVTYRGENRKHNGRSLLVSFRPNHSRQLVGYSLSRTTLSLGQTKTLRVQAVGRRGRSSYSYGVLNEAKYDRNTWWSSSNRNVVTVDGRGKLTARGRGTATITLYFSGEIRTTTVTVE
ncbi:peptidoglycan DD-metalloendopeptidase family protein [Acanthopleuribacter pedis]|uniref:Peptidoglycan DD-metalloendopeptidase family protein n=1 Tax=Acanthopleuribacter pedis TaxID=442870 RepID=A0A8J7QG52_9BACT|nr:peptidoglycan DD-metalloendopeptidase family protein [Acanthopleuribacter pedis]MBO1321675.1 peptidoglycan DD-metalloendopeptidase family protein [Acanthopleuribacter pedis]